MIYHGLGANGAQSSWMAQSADGLHFDALDVDVHGTYLRSFRYRDHHYLLGMPGILYRSSSLTGPYEPRSRLLFDPTMRHAALWLAGDTLHVFWSRADDAPEAILHSDVDLSEANWDEWRATTPVQLLKPELEWEGSQLPVQRSLRGEFNVPANELRDHYILDDNGRLLLYFSGAAEMRIVVAELKPRG